MNKKWVGTNVPRKEGIEKVTGKSKYIDDLTFPDMIYGITVRSDVPRGTIRKIHFADNINWDEFTIVTIEDIPGENVVTLIESDQPFLADKEIRHQQEPILLLAHPDKSLLEEARRSIRIEVDELPAIFNIEESLNKKQIIYSDDNIIKEYLITKGNTDDVWDSAYKIVSEEYHTGAQEQLYIENNGMIAIANDEEVTVWGSMQCPYYIHKALMPLFDLPAEKIRIIQTATGGGFGGKEEYPSIIAGHAALLARKAQKPVKLMYDRAEDMVATTKRHPSHTRQKIAVDENGKLLAIDIDFVLDGGAYTTLSAVVLSRGAIHAAGPYACENIRIRARAVATNTPPQGAFRGFGAPQSIFAFERHLDLVAKQLNMCPVEFRKQNFLQQGSLNATGQKIEEEVRLDKVLDLALEKSQYFAKKKQFAVHNSQKNVKTYKGVGLASFYHGAGFTGSGEVYLASIVGARLTADGKVKVLAASTEIGQGTNTIFSQIAADALGIDYDMVEIETPDTSKVPNSGPTVASRTCMIVGKLVESAVCGIRDTLLKSNLLTSEYTSQQFITASKKYLEDFGELKIFVKYKPPAGIHWDEKNYRGSAYSAYAWAVYVAEVSVDKYTYEMQVDDFVAVQEVGEVVHPILAQGQIEGGVAQGIGYALYEDVVWRNGQMANNQMTNYIIPTSLDAPDIRVFFSEPFQPGGVRKGIGELPMDGTAPAVISAVENATGKHVCHVPLRPEDLMMLYRKET
ncbi:xanthine dehydrogenase family protein molybdopterin-binding subunit [Candidatus Uabimicrobium amorphum]|uniref:Aldehyde oxidase n=1 Tax=Uabimicrobium amorphum TaxID=2596890 RepID=A0A5S9ILA6_UABAM|nr:xanthine dehydrogenase family protein molybdopterin-binding subunit [Candidatus Uabimicrobium amorphum]BBM83631.1 aldehyde oxidase [Candidatus Uabimicrobium amorphum]